MENKLWKGRINKNTEKEAEEFTSSIEVDINLYSYDIEGTAAYAAGLCKIGIIKDSELKKIFSGLKKIKKKIEEGSIAVSEYEDIHSLMENELLKVIGDTAFKIHTGRSRNDQVVLDEKLLLKDIIISTINKLVSLQENILKIANNSLDIIIPAYTHLQGAQPVLFSHYMLSYFYKFDRDIDSLFYNFESCDSLPLGAAACTGSGYELDRELLKKLLKFKSSDPNSMDTVGNRDFIIDFLFACSKVMLHLSRFCEDLIIYNSREFSLIEIDESLCTGSSIMPQKKNPDILELIRGKSALVTGNLLQLMMLVKGLPSTYNRDLQEDKKILFNACKETLSSIDIFSKLIGNIKLKSPEIKESLKEGFLEATDIADYLVKRGESFRNAHNIVGKIIRYCIEKKITFRDLEMDKLKKYSSYFSDDVYDYANISASISHKKVDCGTEESKVIYRLNSAEKKIKDKKRKTKDLIKRIPSLEEIIGLFSR